MKIVIDGSPDNDAIEEKRARLNRQIVDVQLLESENDRQLFEDYYVFALYCYEHNKIQKAYKRVSDDTLLLILFVIDEECYEMRLETYVDREAESRSLLIFFRGEDDREITETAEELLKKYDPTNNLPKYITGAVALALISGGLYFYSVKQKEAEKIRQEQALVAPVQAIPALTENEAKRLKRVLSIDLIDLLKYKALKYAADPLLKDKASIASVGFNYDPKPGVLLMHGTLGLEFTYPVVGSVAGGEEIYTKTEQFELQRPKESVNGIPFAELSVECVKQSLEVPAKDVSVQERTEHEIKIKYSHLKPKDLFDRLEPLMYSCPIVFDTVALQDGGFEISATLYDGEGK